MVQHCFLHIMKAFVHVTLLLAIVVLACGESLKLPSYIKACSRDDPDLNGCVLRNGIEAIPFLLKGDTALHIPVLDPLKVEKVTVQQGSGPVGFTLHLTDALVYGINTAQLKAANFDLEKKVLSVDIAFRDTELRIISKYDIDGKVLLLPIKGNGDMNLTLENASGSYKTNYELVKKADGLEYLKLTEDSLAFDITRAFFNFQNLFNGDKSLGDNMNVFLNENWQEVYTEIKPVVTEVVKSIINKILKEIVNLVSYDTLFPK